MRLSMLCCYVVAASHGSAATITIECPRTFPAEAIHFAGASEGWTAYAPNSLEVHTAELMYGPPVSHAYVAPTTYRECTRRDVGLWEASEWHENWLQCGYGAASEVRLARRLPPVTDCTITKDKDQFGNIERVVAGALRRWRRARHIRKYCTRHTA